MAFSIENDDELIRVLERFRECEKQGKMHFSILKREYTTKKSISFKPDNSPKSQTDILRNICCEKTYYCPDVPRLVTDYMLSKLSTNNALSFYLTENMKYRHMMDDLSVVQQSYRATNIELKEENKKLKEYNKRLTECVDHAVKGTKKTEDMVIEKQKIIVRLQKKLSEFTLALKRTENVVFDLTKENIVLKTELKDKEENKGATPRVIIIDFAKEEG